MGENYLEAFGKLGCKNVHIMDIRKRTKLKTQKLIELKKADCVMFSGGNQSKISNILAVHFSQNHSKRYEKDKFVIAGTSAGAMCYVARND